MKHPLGWAALTLVPVLMAACGASADTAAETDTSAFPVTVDAADAAVEIPEQPERIVSLSATATEILFEIGAGDRVVAADEYSTYPDDAPTTDLSGFDPNVEAVAGYDPDLVFASSDPGDLVASLEQLGIPTIIHPSAATLDDTYTQIEQAGAATGQAAEAAELVARIQADIEEITAEIPERPEPLTYYHELDRNFYSVTSSTFIGQIYAIVGMESIADEAEDASGGYPQLSPEFIVEADPDVILLADAMCCGVDADEVAGRPGWDQLTAVREGRIVELDEDVASRWGPRVVDFLRTVAGEIAAHELVE